MKQIEPSSTAPILFLCEEQLGGKFVAYLKTSNTIHLLYNYDYEIDVDDLNTIKDCSDWIEHISEKPWMPKRHLKIINNILLMFSKVDFDETAHANAISELCEVACQNKITNKINHYKDLIL